MRAQPSGRQLYITDISGGSSASGLDVDGCEGAKVYLHRVSSGVGLGLVSERCEVGGVRVAGHRRATSFEERCSKPAAVVVPSDQATQVLSRRSQSAKVDWGVDKSLEFVWE